MTSACPSPSTSSSITILGVLPGWRSQDAILLGEANVPPPQHLKYFGAADDGRHMMFNFFVNQHLFHALASGDVRSLTPALLKTQKLPGTAQ